MKKLPPANKIKYASKLACSHLLILGLFGSLLFSCSQKSKNTDDEVVTTDDMLIENFSEKFQAIFQNQGILRGFDFKSDSTEIIKNESAELIQKKPNELTYSIDLNEFEAADIIYHFKNDNIDKFEIDLFLKNKESADSMLTELNRYLSFKFGPAKILGDTLHVWADSTKQTSASLKYLDENKFKDMQLIISRKSNEIQ